MQEWAYAHSSMVEFALGDACGVACVPADRGQQTWISAVL